MYPPEQVRRALQDARSTGLCFDDAWPGALAGLKSHGRDRAAWRRALEETRSAWEAAYARSQAPAWFDVLEDVLEEIAA